MARWTGDFVKMSPPGGESFVDVLGRAEKWLAEVHDVARRQHIVCVTHAGFIRAALVVGIGLPAERAVSIACREAHVTALSSGMLGYDVQYMNCSRFQ